MAQTRVQNVLSKPKQDTMTKREKIIYWGATLWLVLGMVSTGAVQLLRVKSGLERWIVLYTWAILSIS